MNESLTAEVAEAQVRAAIATLPALKAGEIYTAEAVSARCRAAVDAVNAAYKVKREEFEAGLFQGHKSEIAALDTRIAELKTKLKVAESMEASHIGVRAPLPCEPFAGRGATPGSPAEHYATWRSLSGPARASYYARYESEVWQGKIEASIE